MTVWAYELAEDHAAAQRICAAATAAASSGGSVDAFAAASYFHGFPPCAGTADRRSR